MSRNDPLTVVLPYCPGDLTQVRELLEWVIELGEVREHKVVLLRSTYVTGEQAKMVLNLASRAFGAVESVATPYALPDESWPAGPNWMFETALKHMRGKRQAFLWLEPDCVPMRKGWLQAIQKAWSACRQRYMGQVIVTAKEGLPRLMLSGVAVYSEEAPGELLAGVTRYRHGPAWDVATANISVPYTKHTRLIWNFHGELRLAPTFAEEHVEGEARNTLLVSRIPKPTVLFHRCKDGSLIKVLRERLQKV